ncbi:cytochrome c oxidase subunit 4 [Leucobacter ruminantium]|uniref:cytochrome-c oxidase n=1 Tax=Leucobacter ruminantium TaxID=1289170 RepID=A0A939LXH3_9MICO|nr:cytochrome c oxidase subunit 4 [Leucobacter ruminantium]MBO1806624.1 cytochrome c oxidase subunit 4 [Leucobacter ruminantium]
MRTHIVIYWILAAFQLFLALLYTGWNLASTHRIEWFGTIAFTFGGAFMAWLAFYLQLVQRKQGEPLSEDRDDADIDDGDPEIGYFQPYSWWPITLALGASLVILGIAVGFWFAYLSLPLLIVSVVGWVYEDYRGNFAR